MLETHDRFEYSAITKRADFSWPERKRLAVYFGINLEHFAFGSGLGANIAPPLQQPDILNYAWREYGNRVGGWRLLELFECFGLPVSLLVNSEIYNHCPELIKGFTDRGDEIVAHGRTNSERQGDLSEAQERDLIRETTDLIEQHEGKRPQGWLGPWISQSRVTPDLLQESGYTYMLDWCHDDQPTWVKTRQGRIMSVPYPQEINDIPAIVARHCSASEFSEMIVDQFDEMKEQSISQPLVFAVALHPYIVGQPFRLRHLRKALSHIAQCRHAVWMCRAGDIAAYCREFL